MQSRSVVAIRSYWFASAARSSPRPWVRANNCLADGAGDPKIHWGDPDGEDHDAEQAARAAMAEAEQQKKMSPTLKTTHQAPPLKLHHSGVSPPPDPTFHQKRSCHELTSDPIKDVSCVGLDGTPVNDPQLEEEDDSREYYREHKPSMLSEVEFVDTRVPLRRATDGGVSDDLYDDVAVIGWREEQIVSAEAALLRAEAMFREAAERGDPDTPWGRVLAGVRR